MVKPEAGQLRTTIHGSDPETNRQIGESTMGFRETPMETTSLYC
jgi:hypothetical protein